MTVEELETKIEEAHKKYHDAIVDGANAATLEDDVDDLTDLKRQLSDMISEGANECPDCKEKPIGRHKMHHADYDIYEVGCSHCALRSRGGSPEKAVDRWNGKQYTPALEVAPAKG